MLSPLLEEDGLATAWGLSDSFSFLASHFVCPARAFCMRLVNVFQLWRKALCPRRLREGVR